MYVRLKKTNYWQKWNPQKLEKKEDTIDQPGKWYIDSGSILINILFEDIFQLKIHVFHGANFFFLECAGNGLIFQRYP